MQANYTVIPDQIDGKTFALAKNSTEYKITESYAHLPETKFMEFEQMKYFLLGMQECIRFKNLKKI